MTGSAVEASGTRGSLSHRPALDGVRALAVLAVVAFHTGVLHAGWVGVDLFFVLSGYLITGLLAAEVDRSGSIALRRFWTRRFRRLVPGLVLLFGLTAMISWLRLTSWRPPSPIELFGAATYTTNWLRVFGAKSYWDMFAGARVPGPFEHTWSLAIEEQFYLVWPVLVWLVCRRAGRQAVLGLAVALLFITAYLQVLLSFAGASTERLYVGTDTRAPAFLVGACCVLAFDHAGRFARWATWVVPAGLAVLAVACLTMDGNSQITYRGPLLAVSAAGAAVVLGAARLVPGSLPAMALSWRPLRLVGRWSYGIYLFHWPIAVLTLGWAWGWARFGVVFAGATALAAASYELVEHPIRANGIPRRRLVPVLAGAVAVIVAVAAVAQAEAPSVSADAKAELQAALPARATSGGAAAEAGAGAVTGAAAAGAPTAGAPTPAPSSSAAEPVSSAPAATEALNASPVGLAPASAAAAPTSTTPPGLRTPVEQSNPSAQTDATRPTVATPTNAVILHPGASRLLIIGDSVPYEIRQQLVEGASTRGILAAVRGAPGCMPSPQPVDQLRVETRALCVKVRSGFAADVATFRPDAVLVYYGLSGNEVRSDGKVLYSCTDEGRAALTHEIDDLVVSAAKVGAVAYLADPIPPPEFPGIPRDKQIAGWRCYRDVYRQIAAAHPADARLLDVSSLLCPDGADCVLRPKLTRDGLHYSADGAALAIPWIYSRIFRGA